MHNMNKSKSFLLNGNINIYSKTLLGFCQKLRNQFDFNFLWLIVFIKVLLFLCNFLFFFQLMFSKVWFVQVMYFFLRVKYDCRALRWVRWGTIKHFKLGWSKKTSFLLQPILFKGEQIAYGSQIWFILI